MSDITLTASHALDGYHKEFNGVTLSEVTDQAIVSLAVPNGGEEKLAAAFSGAYGIDLPQVGQSTTTADRKIRVLGMQRDQLFLLLDYDGDRAVSVVEDKLADAGYYTDQSDSWVCLRMSGAKCRPVLERVCMIDLDPAVFGKGACARTTMEHLGAIIVRDGEDSFLLFSPRSSAKSFLHAIETSIDNVL